MPTDRSPWLRAALFAGLVYLVVGLGFASLAREAGTVWRLAAWVVSAIVFATHIGYELTRLRAAPMTTALHAALAAALGAFGLAVAATVHAVTTASYRGTYALALVAWPLLIGVAAFVAALVIVAGVRLLRTGNERGGA